MIRLKPGNVVNGWKVISSNIKTAFWNIECIHCKTKRIKRRYTLEREVCKCKMREKMKKTCLAKYGVAYTFQDEGIKNKIKKTFLTKYGVEHISQAKEVQDKIGQTNLVRYGSKRPFESKDVRDRALWTLNDKYGVSNPTFIPGVTEKTKQTNLERYGVECLSQLPENRNKLRDWCDSNPEISGGCSKGELELINWIHTFYPSAKKIRNKGLELDIFIPELNLGIEYNGLWYHNELNVEKKYHLNKTNYFRTQGIQVIHVWEHEWKKNESQVKRFLQSALKKDEIKINIKDCQLVWSDSFKNKDDITNFFDQNHILGGVDYEYCCKILYKNKLIGCAIFEQTNRVWVLSRFCTKKNYNISKVLSRVSELAFYNLESDILSWVEYRLSHGKEYVRAGWIEERFLAPDYFYHKSIRTVPKESKYPTKINGFNKIWDCGKIQFRYGKKI